MKQAIERGRVVKLKLFWALRHWHWLPMDVKEVFPGRSLVRCMWYRNASLETRVYPIHKIKLWKKSITNQAAFQDQFIALEKQEQLNREVWRTTSWAQLKPGFYKSDKGRKENAVKK
jgi:hypothetical protein